MGSSTSTSRNLTVQLTATLSEDAQCLRTQIEHISNRLPFKAVPAIQRLLELHK